MAYIPSYKEQQDEKKKYLEGTGKAPAGAGIPLSEGAGGIKQAHPEEARDVDKARQASQLGFLNPLRERLGTQRENLGQTYEQFREQAGPSRSFEQLGGTEKLQQQIQGPDIEQARKMLGARYQGPQRLAQEDVAQLRNQQQNLANIAENLKRGTGIRAQLREYSPGLSAGQRSFEAQRYLQTPEYQQQRQQFQGNVQDFAKRISEREEQAKGYAKQRTGEEQDISERTGEFLKGKRTDIDKAINDLVEKRQQERQQRLEKYQQFEETPNVENLGKIVDKEQAQKFMTPERQHAFEAKQKWDEIMNKPKYAGIKDKPAGKLASTTHGRSYRQYRGAGGHSTAPKNELAYQRQMELEAAGFDPGVEAFGMDRPTFDDQGNLTGYQNNKGSTRQGKYGEVRPIYGGAWSPPDLRNFVKRKTTVSPSRSNLATGEQRTQYNNIQELFGEVERLKDVAPFQAATVATDLKKYLENEEKSLAEHKGKLTQVQKDWKQAIRHARRKYEHEEDKGGWGGLAAIGSALLGASVGVPFMMG